MSDFADLAYGTVATGISAARMKAILEAVVLPKSVYQDYLGLRVVTDTTTAVNPIVRTIKFGFGPTGATTATATVVQGRITGITMTSDGDDYSLPPIVRLVTAKPIITPAILEAFLKVSGLTVVSGGTGYAVAPTVTLMGGLPPADRSFQGCVRTIYLTDSGVGYPPGTTISLDGGGPSGPSSPPLRQAKATLTINPFGRITAVTLTDMGAGYVIPPKISLHTGGFAPTKPAAIFVTMAQGTPATAHSTILAGVVNALILDTPGEGYTNVPEVLITGANTTPASGSARMQVDRVDTRFEGGGYLPATTVVFTPWYKALFPSAADQTAPLVELFKPQFANDGVTPIIAAAPVLT